MRANLAEIMESIQGEGLLVGSRNIFLRFTGCNLRCSYCDTPASLETSDYCQINTDCGRGGSSEALLNPLSAQQVLQSIKHFSARWISLTGGEPLLWADFIAELGPQLKNQGYRLMLETNGLLVDQLELCLPHLDLISMDYKLPSATSEDHRIQHHQFLQRAAKKPVYVKIVIDAAVKPPEVQDAVDIIMAVNTNIPLILQPVTPWGDISAPPLDMLLELQKMCMQQIQDVRVIPQMHKLMGLI